MPANMLHPFPLPGAADRRVSPPAVVGPFDPVVLTAPHRVTYEHLLTEWSALPDDVVDDRLVDCVAHLQATARVADYDEAQRAYGELCILYARMSWGPVPSMASPTPMIQLHGFADYDC